MLKSILLIVLLASALFARDPEGMGTLLGQNFIEITNPDNIYTDRPECAQTTDIDGNSVSTNYPLRLTNLRNNANQADIDELPGRFTESGMFVEGEQVFADDYWEDWGHTRYTSSAPTNESTGFCYDCRVAGSTGASLWEAFALMGGNSSDDFQYIKYIDGRDINIEEYLAINFNALPKARIAYSMDPSNSSKGELRYFIPFETVKTNIPPFTILVNGANVTLPSSVQHSDNITKYPGSTVDLPRIDASRAEYATQRPGLCVLFHAVNSNYPRPESGRPVGATMSSARNQASAAKGCLLPDWGYEGYYYTTEQSCLGGLPPRTVNSTGCRCMEGYKSIVCYNHSSTYLMNCNGLAAGEVPLNRIFGSNLLSCEQYPISVTNIEKNVTETVDCCTPGDSGYAGTDLGYACEYAVRTPTFIDNYSSNRLRSFVTNKTTGENILLTRP